MSDVPATRPEQAGRIIKTPVELREHILGVIENPKYAKHFDGILDRRAVLLAMMKISQNADLVRCKPESIINALTQAGAFGWTCDPITGHAWLVPFGDQATLIPGYRGLMDLVLRAGEAKIMGEVVYECDQYEFRGPYDRPLHVASTDVDRGKRPLTHVYAIATFRDRSVRVWQMTRQECIEHRNAYSKAYRGKESDLWHEKNRAFPAMCRKTVLTRACKSGELPISIQSMGHKLEYLTEDDVPQNLGAVTFQSPAGFDDTLHTEPQAAYSVGDDLAARAEVDVQEQTVPPTLDTATDDEIPVGCEVGLAECKTEAQVATCAAHWIGKAETEAGKVQIRIAADKAVAQLRGLHKASGKPKQRPLPGE